MQSLLALAVRASHTIQSEIGLSKLIENYLSATTSDNLKKRRVNPIFENLTLLFKNRNLKFISHQPL